MPSVSIIQRKNNTFVQTKFSLKSRFAHTGVKLQTNEIRERNAKKKVARRKLWDSIFNYSRFAVFFSIGICRGVQFFAYTLFFRRNKCDEKERQEIRTHFFLPIRFRSVFTRRRFYLFWVKMKFQKQKMVYFWSSFIVLFVPLNLLRVNKCNGQ